MVAQHTPNGPLPPDALFCVQILVGIQELLHTPNMDSAAQATAYHIFKKGGAAYVK